MAWNEVSGNGKGICTGSITLFFAAIVIPFLFICFVIGLDLTSFLRERQKSQVALDDAVLRAWKYLPMQDKASEVAKFYLRQAGYADRDFVVSVGSDSVEARVLSSTPFRIGRFFSKNASVPLATSAVARGTPIDLALLIDTGSYLAPTSVKNLWGSEQEWPAAELFSSISETPEEARFMTELCFSPPFLSLKRASILIYEYLSSYKRNNLAVMSYPGQLSATEDIRPMTRVGAIKDGSWEGEAKFVSQARKEVSSVLCAAAYQEESHHLAYRVPRASASVKLVWNQPRSAYPMMLKNDSWVFNESYAPSLSLRESIWSLMVSDGPQDTAAALQDGFLKVFLGPQSGRGGLTGHELKRIILLMGDVPRVGAARFGDGSNIVEVKLSQVIESMRSELGVAKEAMVNVTFVILGHTQSPADVLSQAENLSDFLKKDAETYGDLASRLSMQVVYASSTDKLVAEVASQIVSARKSAVLSW